MQMLCDKVEPVKNGDETLDTFYHGRILVLQKKKGYRFSVDSPLLADFIQTNKSEELLELGTGNGIISLLLSIKPFKHIKAVEIQESLVDLARRNVSLNGLEDKIDVVHGDLRMFCSGRKFDVVFSNPPYIKMKQGHLSASKEKSIAKHELKCDIFDIMRKTEELLKKEGRAYFVYPMKRKKDFMDALGKHKLKIKVLRYVMPRKERDPHFFMAECNFTSEKEMILPPLVLFDDKGSYTSETKEIFSGREHARSS